MPAARMDLSMVLPEPRFAEINWQGRPVCIEHVFLASASASAAGGPGCAGADVGAHQPAAGHTDAGAAGPLLVFLHEGLGSLAMWKDFPQRLCNALGVQGLVYSRPGYGRSTPRAAGETWAPDFMHRQAHDVLPALLAALRVKPGQRPVWLFGHSDGGSIALLHAARPEHQIAGLIVLAPHIVVEDLSIASIDQARQAYAHTDLRDRLAKYHADPDSAFRGWNDIWLHPDFRDWSITEEIATIACPVLAVQGLNDEYGTLAQVRGIARHLPQTCLLELPDCGHSPHRDQPDRLIGAVQAFMAGAATIAHPSTETPPGDPRP